MITFLCINRNIVECKEINRKKCCGFLSVLIETLWNVKVDVAAMLTKATIVLIETLWNVKTNTSKWQIGAKWY